VRAVLAGDARIGQGGQEAGRAVEVGHVQVGRAHPGRVVRVRPGPARQGKVRRQRGGPVVQRLVGELGVEDLDDVDGAFGTQPGQDRAQAVTALVERVRGVDQARLGPYPGDDLVHGKHVGHPFGKKEADEVSVGRPDLLPDHDPDPEVPRGHRGRDLVVVGDAHHVQGGLAGPVGELLQGQHGVAGRDRVQVAVDPDPAHRGASSASSSWE
jgi:hypothetical protein